MKKSNNVNSQVGNFVLFSVLFTRVNHRSASRTVFALIEGFFNGVAGDSYTLLLLGFPLYGLSHCLNVFVCYLIRQR